jgi:uncharacterized protein
MIPLRLVLDTNGIASAALKPDGLPRTVLMLAMTRPAQLYASPGILAEYREVIARPELRIRKGLRRQFLQLIKNHSRSVHPACVLQVAKDPDDNKFLECADAARADYLVTGNLRHCPKFLEENQGDHARRAAQHRGSASGSVETLLATSLTPGKFHNSIPAGILEL